MPRQALRPPVLAALAALFVAPGAGVPGAAAQAPAAYELAAQDQAAQEPAAQDSGRPRVGLVLGGGGARGIAHVGVLGVLEELGVRVDVVVGTSMGAIVGALYASGMPPQAMDEWVRAADWDELFRDQASFRNLSFRRKREYRAFPIPLELGVSRHGVSTPSGFIAGQKLNAALRGLLLPVATVRDFDDLPIPYRAIATELATGRMVVLERGDLVDAVRASMSAPGVFSPYRVGDRLLADGGLTANLPAHVARTLGADVLIVVDVGAPLLREDELTTPMRAAVQVATILTQAGAEAQRQTLQPGDILIAPDLEYVRSTGFGYALEALAAGEAAARRQVSALRGLAVDPVAFMAWVDTVRAVRPLPPTIDFVDVGDLSRRAPRSNLDRVRIRPGAALDTLVIAADVDRLYQVGIYERTDYRLTRLDEGLILSYEVREKPWGRNYLRFRLSVSDNFAGESSYNFATNLRAPHITSWGGELVAEVEVGNTRALRFELYQPLRGSSGAFLAPYAGTARFPRDVYEAGKALARYDVDGHRYGMAAGWGLGAWAEGRAGVEIGQVSATPRIGSPDLPDFRAALGTAYVQLQIDALDDPIFPRRGFSASVVHRIEHAALGADDPHTRLAADFLLPITRGRTTFLAGGSAATSLDSTLPPYDPFTLGGFMRLTGYPVGEVAGNHLLLGRLIVFRPVRGDGVFGGVILEAGNVWESAADMTLPTLRHSAAAAIGFRTLLGPVYLGYGLGDGNRRQTTLTIGRSF